MKTQKLLKLMGESCYWCEVILYEHNEEFPSAILYYLRQSLTIRDGFEDEQSSLLKGEKMLKTYRIIPLVFILFLFGFTFIIVSPVFAEDSPEFMYPASC